MKVLWSLRLTFSFSHLWTVENYEEPVECSVANTWKCESRLFSTEVAVVWETVDLVSLNFSITYDSDSGFKGRACFYLNNKKIIIKKSLFCNWSIAGFHLLQLNVLNVHSLYIWHHLWIHALFVLKESVPTFCCFYPPLICHLSVLIPLLLFYIIAKLSCCSASKWSTSVRRFSLMKKWEILPIKFCSTMRKETDRMR